jgi:hypothetical protein
MGPSVPYSSVTRIAADVFELFGIKATPVMSAPAAQAGGLGGAGWQGMFAVVAFVDGNCAFESVPGSRRWRYGPGPRFGS